MENISSKTEYPCSGCGACAAVCPKDAISLEMDDVGLLSAVIDASRCINCGLCMKACTRFEETVDGSDIREAKLFAVQSSDPDTVKRCSSGGLAHELAMDAITNGWKAVGAVYDTESNRVFHVAVDDAAGVLKLDGSKYLQSDTQQAFSEIIDEAVKDAEARFTVFGTPCQIAGLAKVCELLQIRDRFLLVEIFCHGVPPYKLWEHQMERMRKKLKTHSFDNVQFRYKKNGWHSYCIRAEAEGRVFYGAREREPFWHVYFENVLLGDACMTCRLRKEISLADLRIGDYWGRRFQNRNDGISAAFACTERGKRTVEWLITEGKLISMEPGSTEEMLSAQNMRGYRKTELHDESMEMIRSGSPAMRAARHYRRQEPLKKKLKRSALCASCMVPDGLRARIKKATGGRTNN